MGPVRVEPNECPPVSQDEQSYKLLPQDDESLQAPLIMPMDSAQVKRKPSNHASKLL